MKNPIKATLLLSATLLLGACADRGASTDEAETEVAVQLPERTLTVGAAQEPPSLNFWTESSSVTTEVGNYLVRGLVYVDDQGEVQPDLVEEVPSEDNGLVELTRDADGNVTGMTVRWTIRENATWSDGTPITTDDVIASHRIFSDERLPVPSREGVPASIEAVDERTFIETHEVPYLFYRLGNVYPILNGEQWTAAYEQAEQSAAGDDAAFVETFTNNDLVNSNGASNLITSGPFTVSQWNRGQNLALERRDGFWFEADVANPAARVNYVFYGDNNTLVTNVITGTLDAVSSAGLPSNPDTLRSLDRAKETYLIDTVTQANWEHLDINKFENVAKVKELGLDDKRTRQALTYAIDREAIVRDALQGLGNVSNVYVNSDSPYYLSAADDAYPHDPERATELLGEMGWTPGPDGVLQRTVNGKNVKFELEFVTTAGNPLRERIQQVIQSNLQDIGVQVRVNNAPPAVVFDDAYFSRASEGKWNGAFMFTWNSQPLALDGTLFAHDDPTTELPNDFVPTAESNYSGQNIGGWYNDEYQQLWVKARTEFDDGKRRELFERMQEILIEEVPAIPLYEARAILIAKNDLQNYNFNAYTRVGGWNSWNIGWNE